MDKIDWASYALDYDAMCHANPAYAENIAHLKNRFEGWHLPPNPKVLDIGAGTGAFICAVGDLVDTAQYTHLDFNPSMNAQALIKYKKHGLDVNVIESAFGDINLPRESQDLVICVNALYAMPQPHAMLRKIRRLTKPGGKFFIIDFGRQMRVSHWSAYILKSLVRTRGVPGALAWFWRYRDVLKQNRRGMRAQRKGGYWLHSSVQFANALERSGWHIEELTTCYQGYCDLAVCRSNLSVVPARSIET